ncbi:hypothetical protein [Mycolicibacterium llatzerense]|uniref:hypothetical protein n=1 Tax=Mycolicibacterium llatzerense TaxID=280871 RepID=UPI0021B6D2E8|nr:hypothetical protein [Mycolicibacterium llatzerense]
MSRGRHRLFDAKRRNKPHIKMSGQHLVMDFRFIDNPELGRWEFLLVLGGE